jgi:hypothetical protein
VGKQVFSSTQFAPPQTTEAIEAQSGVFEGGVFRTPRHSCVSTDNPARRRARGVPPVPLVFESAQVGDAAASMLPSDHRFQAARFALSVGAIA